MKPRRIGPGRSSTRGRARAVSVVIDLWRSFRARVDRPTVGRDCGAIRRQACFLQRRRGTRRRCARHGSCGVLGGFWGLGAWLSSDDGPSPPFGRWELRCYTPPPRRRALPALISCSHSRIVRGKKGSHLEGRAHSTGPEARAPGAATAHR